MDSQQMYTYRLAAEAWHRLLQPDQSPIRNPLTGSSTIEIPAGDPMTIIHRNPSAHLSSHLSCVRPHRLPLNRPCRHRPRIKRTKCILCELFIDWATDSGRARNKAWP
jgi:hypothetical protein